MGLLTGAQILAAVDLPSEVVKVPEWAVNGDDEVRVRGLTAGERDVLQTFWGNETKLDDEKTARVCAMCMVDDSGNRLFTDAQIGALKAKSFQALDRVLAVVYRLSGMGVKAPAAEDIQKN